VSTRPWLLGRNHIRNFTFSSSGFTALIHFQPDEPN
jgi:hypothetical protein